MTQTPAATHTILVVDDSEVARQEIVNALVKAGFTTAEAENGQRAVERAMAGGISLIVSDIHMPQMNGIEMCEALHKALGATLPPVLIVSTEAGADMKARGKAAGVRGWVIKPVDTAKLVVVANKLLGK